MWTIDFITASKCIGRPYFRCQSLSTASLTDGVSNAGGQVIRLRAASSLRVDANGILSATGTGKATALVVAGLERLNGTLQTGRGLELALGIVGLENRAVVDLDTHKTGRQVGVGSQPLLGGPALVGKDSLDKKHVGQGITNGLVNQVGESLEAFKSVLLCGRLRLGVLDDLQGVFGESDGTMAVGLEVHTDIEAQGCVVEMLHTGVGADDRELEDLLNVVCAGPVGVGGLNDTDLKLGGNSGVAGKVADERGGEGSDAVSVKETEDVALVLEVVDQTIGITVERRTAVQGASLGRRRSTCLLYTSDAADEMD